MNRIIYEVNFVKRETPRIGGSSTAFIVVIVVLVAIIITSCSAVVYILRKSALEDQETQRRRRYNTHPLRDGDPATPRYSKKWYSYIWASRDRQNNKRRTMMGHGGQGWIRTNDREWDVESAHERDLRPSEANQSTLLRMSEQGPSGSILGTHVYTPCVHSPTSDTASSLYCDPHDLRSLPRPGPFGLSPQATISSRSQLASPTSSSPPSPVPRQITQSPEPIAHSPSHDSSNDSVQDSLQQSVASTLRTFGSGTKFFESL